MRHGALVYKRRIDGSCEKQRVSAQAYQPKSDARDVDVQVGRNHAAVITTIAAAHNELNAKSVQR